MRLIITEQQAARLLNSYSDIIKNILDQKNIEVEDVIITPSFFPQGLKVIVKLVDNRNKEAAKKLVKGVLSSLVSFGQQELSFN